MFSQSYITQDGINATAISLLNKPRKNKVEAKIYLCLRASSSAPITKSRERISALPTIDVTASVWIGRNIKNKKPAKAAIFETLKRYNRTNAKKEVRA